MKIGLVRHFKVKRGYPSEAFISQSGLMQWMDEYDASDIEPGETDLGGIEWKRCYASPLARAATTARIIYDGDVEEHDALREIRMYPLFKRNVKLPFLLWPVMMRIAWLLDHESQLERKAHVQKRAADVLDDILAQNEGNVLIVSHGGIMMYLRKELVKRGFTGPKLGRPKNGQLYLFEQK